PRTVLKKKNNRHAASQTHSYKQQDNKISGHSLECRINAEDPEKFTPCPGMITKYSAPDGFGVRVESVMEPNTMVVPFYDSMIAKVITHGRDRQDSIARMRRALDAYMIEGITTTIPL